MTDRTTPKTELLPPHDIAAEEAFLGAILLDESGMDQISLKDSDFYHEPHGFIFKAFTRFDQSKTHIDEITVAEELNRMDKLEAARCRLPDSPYHRCPQSPGRHGLRGNHQTHVHLQTTYRRGQGYREYRLFQPGGDLRGPPAVRR